MNLLVLNDKPPSMRLGDGLRMFGLLRPLRPRHRFDLLCFARPGDEIESDANELFSRVSTLPFPVPTDRGRFGRKIANALRLGNFKASSGSMRDAITEADASGRYDLLLDVSANMLLTLPPEALRTPLVVDSIDEPLLRDLRAIRCSSPTQWPRLTRQLYLYWRYERETLARAAVNVYASELDANFYRRLFPGRRCAFVPNGVDLDFFQSPPNNLNGCGYIVFEGNMMFPPNVDAAVRLCRQILPRVQAKEPSARVVVVGREPAPGVRSLASPSVEITGTVPDVRPYLAEAKVFACPMRLGSGIKNKILQAWAMGLPVVATSQSIGGLLARDGENILIRDSWDAFADAIVELLSHREQARALGDEGRRTVERHYSWERCADAFERILESARLS